VIQQIHGICGNRNKKGISDSEPPEQDELEIVQEEPQSSKEAEIEALRKEVEAPIEALRSQQWVNQEGFDFENPFGNNFVNMDHQQQREEIHLARAPNLGSWRAREPLDHRFSIPKPHRPPDPRESHFVSHRERDFEGERDFEPHCGPIHGSSHASPWVH
jgi:hypothetical protein